MPPILFAPESLEKETWRKVLRWARKISRRETTECDICLIGSHSRGNASP